MNPVFIFLVILALFIFWVLMSFSFKYIGIVVKKLFNETKENINKK